MFPDALFTTAGAAAWGAVGFGGLAPWMEEAALARAEALCPGPAGLFVCAFPYFAGDTPGSLSLYARGEDYHRVVVERLGRVCRAMEERWPENRFVPSADNSPIPEKPAALLAGLGVLGENSLVILPTWGSYVFFGTILTDLGGPWPEPAPIRPCLQCGRCAAVCPGGALDRGRVDRGRCLSGLTQQKGALRPDQEALIARHPLVWGCDFCQLVCPCNQNVPVTPIGEFRKDLISDLTAGDLAGLTNRQFQETYARRAFAWRGPAVLRRNLELQRSKDE